MRGTRIVLWCAASAVAGAVVAGAFAAALMAQGSRPPQAPRPYVQAGPQPNGTPVPRTAWGKADLSGVWNKRPHGGSNMALGIQPLPFTPAGLKAYNNAWNEIDPTSRCVFPGVPRLQQLARTRCRSSTCPTR